MEIKGFKSVNAVSLSFPARSIPELINSVFAVWALLALSIISDGIEVNTN